MNRSRLLFLVFSALFVLPMLLALVVAAAPARGQHTAADKDKDKEEDSYDSYLKYLKVFSEVYKLVHDAYVDQPNSEALMAGAFEGITDSMDPYSVYVPASAVAGYSHALATGKTLSGIAFLKERGATLVMSVEKGSPADAAGLKVGDLVAKLNGESTRTMPLWQVQEAIDAAPGTAVKMEVIRLGAPVPISFTLKTFAPPVVTAAEVDENGAPAAAPGAHAVPGGLVTVLRIPDFDAATVQRVKPILGGDLHGKLIVDLRGVSAGDPAVAYDVAGLFTSGALGTLVRRDSQVQSFSSAAPPAWHGRLVVLVDRGTGGAAEVFATVLHQRNAAELVGERTLGYAGRRASADLSTGSRLYYTDAFYTGPDKKPINESLRPDVQVNERTRSYLEKDIPTSELILRRGLHHLLEESPAPAKKAA